jgi:hypothetical protein
VRENAGCQARAGAKETGVQSGHLSKHSGASIATKIIIKYILSLNFFYNMLPFVEESISF